MDSLLLDKNNLQDALNNNNHKQLLLKWTLKLVVSIILVCLFLCPGFPFVHHSLYVYYNTWLFSFLTQTLEKKYMFLICNGILAFLAKNSLFWLPQSDSDQPQLSLPGTTNIETNEEVPEESMEVVMDVEEVTTQHSQKEIEEEKQVIEVEEKVEENDQVMKEEENEELILNETLEEQDEEEDEVVVYSHGIPRAQYYSEEESREVDSYYGYEEMGMSNEELNRRFEEIIRKMKEKIRIEAQRPLIITA